MDGTGPNPVMAMVNKLATMQEQDEATQEPGEQPNQPATRSSNSPLSGQALLVDPDAALQAFRTTGGTDRELVEWYASGASPAHLLRTGAQPQMLKAGLKAMVPSLSRQLCREAGVKGVGPMLLAEQVAEARVDECYHRMLAGLALEADDIARADRLQRMADRHSTRMTKALDQLHRMKRPKVTVRVDRVSNLNLGTQEVGTPGARPR